MARKRKKYRIGLRSLVVAAAMVMAGVSFVVEQLSPPPADVAFLDASGAVALHILDVGQGSGALLRTLETTVLIDAGEREYGRSVCDYLRAQRVERLDLVILTHPHTDHFGGLLAVLEEYPVDLFMMPRVPRDLIPTNSTYLRLLEALEQNGCEIVFLTQPIDYDCRGATLRILGPFLEDPPSLNDTSLCMRIDCDQASFLITGDGETAVEDALREGGAPIDVDVLVAGHHGSNTSSRQLFLNAVRPRASVISCGIENSYGLPSERTLERLAAFGAIYRTDLNGTVVFLTDGQTIQVSADTIDDTIDARG